jgi:hypothetical protein
MFNIDSKTLNCVLLGIIIVFIIIFLVKNTKNKIEENIGVNMGENIGEEEKKTVENINEEKQNDDTNSDIDKDEDEIILPFEREKQYDLVSDYQNCNFNEMEDMNHRLIRDIVIGKKYQQEEKQQEFTRKDIDNYFLQYQDFNDKINYSSQNKEDVVEKIAEERTKNAELFNKQNKTISKIFDGMTQDQLDNIKKCKYQECILPSQYDNLTQSKYYLDKNINNFVFSDYETRYETDNVNNGGKYYDDIEAHDENLMNNFKNAMVYQE